VTLTGLITPQTALMLTQLHTSEAARDAYQRRSGANDNSAAMAIASPVASLVDNAQSQLESARDQVKSAEEQVKSAQESAKRSAETQPMANATKSEPQLDPYLSRNASVYYGTATEQFYKEISWQEASLNAANESLSNDQEALATAQQQLSTAQAHTARRRLSSISSNRLRRPLIPWLRLACRRRRSARR
jgi:outer membrane murein-binding lipoprotein Lpp